MQHAAYLKKQPCLHLSGYRKSLPGSTAQSRLPPGSVPLYWKKCKAVYLVESPACIYSAGGQRLWLLCTTTPWAGPDGLYLKKSSTFRSFSWCNKALFRPWDERSECSPQAENNQKHISEAHDVLGSLETANDIWLIFIISVSNLGALSAYVLFRVAFSFLVKWQLLWTVI